jgi:hypothetical protein
VLCVCASKFIKNCHQKLSSKIVINFVVINFVVNFGGGPHASSALR